MEIPCNQLPPGDPRLVDALVGQLKSKGIFDKFRKECLADVDTKPAFLNLRQRVDGQVKKFLSTKTWRSDLNKNQLRDGVRKNIQESGILDSGIDAIINQVVNPKIKPFILPLVEDTVYSFLQVEKPKREIQEYDIPIQPVAAHLEEKSPFYGQHMSMPQPCPPYHPAYQEFPPEFVKSESSYVQSKISPEIENNVEDSSVSSESEVSMDKTEEDQKPVQSHPTIPVVDMLPMETDVISSGDDDILARASPDSSTSLQEKKIAEEEIKMEEDNAVDSFDAARREADTMTAAVESMTLRDEKLKTDSESHDTPKDASASLPLFDNKSLDSISSNTSGLSFSPTSRSKSITLKNFQSQLKEEGASPNKSLDELRSTQSTPLVDEKSLNDSEASETSKSWIPYTLPKDLLSAERITIASFGPIAPPAESARVVEGASPVSNDYSHSQGSVEREELPSLKDKASKAEKSEGEITSSSSSSISSVSSTSPTYKDNAVVGSSTDKDEVKIKIESTKECHSSEGVEGERSKSKEKHGKEKKRSKDRDHRRSKSKYDDHYSHHDKDKRHRRDKDDDKDRDRHSKGHFSGNSGRTMSSGDAGSKEREKYKDKSSDHKSHSKSHSSSHSKSHSSSHSKSRTSSHSKSHSSSHSSSSRHRDREHRSSSTSKSEKREEKLICKQERSSDTSRDSKPSSKDVKQEKEKKRNETAKLKPVKLIEDNIFAMHLENNKKDAVLPKPVNSLVQKHLVLKTNTEAKVVPVDVKTEDKVDNITEDKAGSKGNDIFKDTDNKMPKDKVDKESKVNVDNEKCKEGKENKDIKINDNDKDFSKEVDKKDKNIKIKGFESGSDKLKSNKNDLKQSSQSKSIVVNGLTIKHNIVLEKRKLQDDSGDNASASDSESDSDHSRQPVNKIKRRESKLNRKCKGKLVKKLSGRSLESKNSSSSSSSEEDKNNIKVLKAEKSRNKTEVYMYGDNGQFTPRLKKVTIPLINISNSDLGNIVFSHPQETKNVKWRKNTKTISVFNEMFGNSSDESEFEGFDSTEIPYKNIILKQTPISRKAKNLKRSSTSIVKTGLDDPSQAYVVLCDSSDSSDMEVSIVDLSTRPGPFDDSPKPNDFEGFDDEGFDSKLPTTGDQKLRDYLSRFSFGSTVQIDDFISVESDEEEIGEESTVFFNKKNTTKSVIEEIAAKQYLNSIGNESNDENNLPNTIVVEATVHTNMESTVHTTDMDSTVHTTDMESYKPFKKRKLSSVDDKENECISPPSKVTKIGDEDEGKSPVKEAVLKDLVLSTYSMLTPEEDRTSSKDYEVDLGRREASYSPLSPASDSSSDALLKHKNESKTEEVQPETCSSSEATSS